MVTIAPSSITTSSISTPTSQITTVHTIDSLQHPSPQNVQTIQYHSQIPIQQIPSIETIRTHHSHHMPSLHPEPSIQSQLSQIHVIRGPNDVMMSSPPPSSSTSQGSQELNSANLLSQIPMTIIHQTSSAGTSGQQSHVITPQQEQGNSGGEHTVVY